MATRKPREKSVREPAVTYSTRPLSEVMWLAFASLSEEDRTAFLQRLLDDPDTFEDLADSIMIIERRDEPSRPYEEFHEELKREGLL